MSRDGHDNGEDGDHNKKQGRDCTRVISSLANLTIQYNFQAIPVALLFMDNDSSDSVVNSTAAFPRCV
mgnify:CR=1 FL=1